MRLCGSTAQGNLLQNSTLKVTYEVRYDAYEPNIMSGLVEEAAVEAILILTASFNSKYMFFTFLNPF
jgi:hypothetical protein